MNKQALMSNSSEVNFPAIDTNSPLVDDVLKGLKAFCYIHHYVSLPVCSYLFVIVFSRTSQMWSFVNKFYEKFGHSFRSVFFQLGSLSTE